MVQGLGFRGFRGFRGLGGLGFGFRACSGFRVQGLGFTV